MPTARQILEESQSGLPPAASAEPVPTPIQVTLPRDFLVPPTKKDDGSMRDEMAIRILTAMIQARVLNVQFDSCWPTASETRQNELESHDKRLKRLWQTAYRTAEVGLQIRNMTRTELLDCEL